MQLWISWVSVAGWMLLWVCNCTHKHGVNTKQMQPTTYLHVRDIDHIYPCTWHWSYISMYVTLTIYLHVRDIDHISLWTWYWPCPCTWHCPYISMYVTLTNHKLNVHYTDNRSHVRDIDNISQCKWYWPLISMYVTLSFFLYMALTIINLTALHTDVTRCDLTRDLLTQTT